MYSKLMLFYFIYFCVFNILIVKSEECQLSESCVVINDCPTISPLVQKKPLPQETIEYLRKIHCGFSGRQSKVCCPITPKNPTVPGTLELLPSRKVCGKQAEDRIIQGVNTTIREYPWMILLEYKISGNDKEFKCGGFLISNRYALTAAHCMMGLPEGWKLIGVRLGEHNIKTPQDCEDTTPGLEDCNDEPLDITIEQQIPHEMYNSLEKSRYYDIGLLRLSKPVEFTPFIRPLCLPLSERLRNKDYTGQELTVAGWGRTETRAQSDVKLKVEVPVISRAECVTTYEKHRLNLLSNQVCAGGVEHRDSCTGDSGGPLMVVDRTEKEENYIAYAIVSFGPVICGTENFPAVYTRLGDYIDWIRDHLKP